MPCINRKDEFMKRPAGYRNSMMYLACLAVLSAAFMVDSPEAPVRAEQEKIRSTSSPHASFKSKMGRVDYFFRMLRDPELDRVPPNIRQRELAYARTLPRQPLTRQVGSAEADFFTWQEGGPYDVGGRTRALAVDTTNPNTIIAGGVSGGIWKSTDGGGSWTLKTALNTPLSVTWIAQDPRVGETSTWYYITGEFIGSADDFGSKAPFFGHGIYKSTDNGETWFFLSATIDNDETQFDTPFDYMSRIVVHPVNGSLFVASNGSGIYRSTNGGASFSLVLGGDAEHTWNDVVVASDGTLLAVLSETSSGALIQLSSPGVYKSTDNGDTWTNITPNGFPANHDRSVLAFAPSNPDAAYILTSSGAGNRGNVALYKITVSTNTFEDRSGNIPDFGDPAGFMNTQGSYNMALAVKPDNENTVFIGGTNLYRSFDGFATQPTNRDTAWVGGYAHDNNFSQYTGHHSDQHVLVFDPTNPDVMWSGHDGGIARTLDADAVPMAWQDKNSGYNVTQFYTVGIASQAEFAGSTEVGGGTQDNGTPTFDWTQPNQGSVDITSGDGGFLYIGKDQNYASVQEGVTFRRSKLGLLTQIAPPPGGNAAPLFIHPFAVDPSDEGVMYYPLGHIMWRNAQVDVATSENQGWVKLDNISGSSGTLISALSVSTDNPDHRLYYATSGSGSPQVFRLDNANTATSGQVDISILGAPVGAYVHQIAVNPTNADEIMVVMSNYNIVGLYHSTDAGASYTAVEGNLKGTTETPGPSLRWAAIMPQGATTQYLVATSVGLFGVSRLDGSDTIWGQEAADKMGNVVVAALDTRLADGTIAAATHGRGVFIGVSSAQTKAVATDTSTVIFTSSDNTQTTVSFQSGSVGGSTVTYQYFGNQPPPSVTGFPTFSQPLQYFNIDSSLPDTATFEAQLTVGYTQAQSGAAGISNENDLKLFRWNTDNESWQQMATTVDAAGNTASAVATKFSTWALAGSSPTGIEEDRAAAGSPQSFSLKQNAPNPFNPATTIRYTLAEAGPVRLAVYNIQGRAVRTLVDRVQHAGTYEVVWDGRTDLGQRAGSGVYLYRLIAGEQVRTRKMTLLK